MGTGGIYEIVNTVNGKRYIGSAVNFERRWASHRTALSCGEHKNRKLQNSWDKHGGSVFQFLPMMTVEDPEKLVWWEQRFLDALKPEYNLSPTAGSNLGVKWSPEQRVKMLGNTHPLGAKRSEETLVRMSESMRGKNRGPRSAEHSAKIGEANRGKKHSPETLIKMSESHTGKKHSPETCAKISEIRKGKPTTLGHECLPETRRKISEAQIGKTLSDDHCVKISVSMIGNKNAAGSKGHVGKKRSSETCSRIGESKRGKKHSPESKEKMSAAGTRRWANVRVAKAYERLMQFAWAGA